jgi:hypothetical protein
VHRATGQARREHRALLGSLATITSPPIMLAGDDKNGTQLQKLIAPEFRAAFSGLHFCWCRPRQDVSAVIDLMITHGLNGHPQ